MSTIHIPGAQTCFLLGSNLGIQLLLSVANEALIQYISIIPIESCFKVLPRPGILLDESASYDLFQGARDNLRCIHLDLNLIVWCCEGAVERQPAGEDQEKSAQN